MTKTHQLWEPADPDQKRRFQKLIFPEGLTFDGEAIGTPATALLFSALGPEMTAGERLVAQTVGSSNTKWDSNTLFAWLHEVAALKRAA